MNKNLLLTCPLLNFKYSKSAFTLIELLVVVLIIGILAAIAVPQYQKAVEKARAIEVVTAVKTLSDAYKRVELATGSHPSSFEELDIDFPGKNIYKREAGGEFMSFSKDWSILMYSVGIAAYYSKEEVRILYVRDTGITWCSTAKGKSDSLCKNIGAKPTDPPTTYCYWGTGDSCLVISRS